MELKRTARDITGSRREFPGRKSVRIGIQAAAGYAFAMGILEKYRQAEGYDLPSASFVYPDSRREEEDREAVRELVSQLSFMNRIRVSYLNQSYERKYYWNVRLHCEQLLLRLSGSAAMGREVRELREMYRELVREHERAVLQTSGRQTVPESRGEKDPHRREAFSEEDRKLADRKEQRLKEILRQAERKTERRTVTGVMMQGFLDGLPSRQASPSWKAEPARQFFWKVQRSPRWEQEILFRAAGVGSLPALEKRLSGISAERWTRELDLLRERTRNILQDRELLETILPDRLVSMKPDSFRQGEDLEITLESYLKTLEYLNHSNDPENPENENNISREKNRILEMIRENRHIRELASEEHLKRQAEKKAGGQEKTKPEALSGDVRAGSVRVQLEASHQEETVFFAYPSSLTGTGEGETAKEGAEERLLETEIASMTGKQWMEWKKRLSLRILETVLETVTESADRKKGAEALGKGERLHGTRPDGGTGTFPMEYPESSGEEGAYEGALPFIGAPPFGSWEDSGQEETVSLSAEKHRILEHDGRRADQPPDHTAEGRAIRMKDGGSQRMQGAGPVIGTKEDVSGGGELPDVPQDGAEALEGRSAMQKAERALDRAEIWNIRREFLEAAADAVSYLSLEEWSLFRRELAETEPQSLAGESGGLLEGPVFSWLQNRTGTEEPETPEVMSAQKGELIRALLEEASPKRIFGAGYEILRDRLVKSRILSSYLPTEEQDGASRTAGREQGTDGPEGQKQKETGSRIVRRIRELSGESWRIFLEELKRQERADAAPAPFLSFLEEESSREEDAVSLAEEKQRVLEYLDRGTDRIPDTGPDQRRKDGLEIRPGAFYDDAGAGRTEAAALPESEGAGAWEDRRAVQLAERVLELLRQNGPGVQHMEGSGENVWENAGEGAARTVRRIRELSGEAGRNFQEKPQKEEDASAISRFFLPIMGREDSVGEEDELPLAEKKRGALEFFEDQAGPVSGQGTGGEAGRSGTSTAGRRGGWADQEIQIQGVLREIRGKAMELFLLPPADRAMSGSLVYLKTSADPLWQPEIQDRRGDPASLFIGRETAVHTLERLRQKRIRVEQEESLAASVGRVPEAEGKREAAAYDGPRKEQMDLDPAGQGAGIGKTGAGRPEGAEEQTAPVYSPADLVINQGAGNGRQAGEPQPENRMAIKQEVRQQVKEEITDIQFITRSQTVTQEGSAQDRLQLENLLRRMESQEKELERIKKDRETGSEAAAEARVSRSVMKKLQDQMQMERLRRGL